ncbi:hypothetical protein F4604DRAFT_1676770 [Suillus subluteus]|nr:hypothetical protein F4604DRAFT_1676770 [Suillus subluteus]
MPLAFDGLNAVLPSLTPPELPVLAESLAFEGQLSDLEYGPLGFTDTLPEAMGLSIGNLSQDLLPGAVSYGLGVPGLLPQYDTHSNGKTLSESSARHDQQPCLPIVQDGRHKVTCSWPGCSRTVQKNSLARHVNEMHRRVVKAVCDSCGKGFEVLSFLPYVLRTPQIHRFNFDKSTQGTTSVSKAKSGQSESQHAVSSFASGLEHLYGAEAESERLIDRSITVITVEAKKNWVAWPPRSCLEEP